ncbi:reverse transcriptase domain-containing protein [Tanacetum coccineum]
MVKPEKPKKKKDQIEFDREVAQRLQDQLQAELEEEERLAKQREESTNIAEWDDVQAMMDADYELATRLQEQERGELTIEERSMLFNMVGYKHTQLKNKSFEEIQMLFEKEMKRVNIFVDMDAKLVKGSETIESEVDREVPKLAAGSSKRAAEEEPDQESSKRRGREAEDVQMADHLRPMEELLLIPDTRSNNSFFGLENDDSHSHIKRFCQITRTLRLNQVPDDVVKLIVFPFSLKGAAETWLENEPLNSITSWDDLVSKFLNRFFPHSKIRELKKEIMNFQQVFGETFTEAWERFKYLLRKCPHHGFSLLHQIDFFYNGLSQSDQDFLNTAASGNLMSKNTHEALTIIENKAKVRTCRNKSQVSSSVGSSTQIDAITALTKQAEALISSMQEAYNRNQEASIQLMQTQMGQMEETFQERPSCVPPSDTETYPQEERKAKRNKMSGVHNGKWCIIVALPSTPLIPNSRKLLPLSHMPDKKEDPKPNPHQPSIPYPSRLQEEKFQALENFTGRADHFVYRIDIVDSLCDKFPIKNNSLSGNPTPSSDFVVESLSPLPIPYEDSDSLVEETDILLSHFDDSPPEYETFSFDIEEM